MIFFNFAGLGMVLLGGFVFVWLGEMAGDRIGFLTGGILMIAVDLVYRYKKKHPFSARYIRSRCGGHVMFIPVWIIGAIIFVFSLA